jgi:DNA polymerase III gamma/tau subunit
LEEPKPSVILFLISSGSVLPTIASRCQTFQFNRLSQEGMKEFALAQKLSQDEALANFCAGRPGLYAKLLQDSDAREGLERLTSQIKSLHQDSLTSKLDAVKQLAEAESADLVEALSLFLQQKSAQNLSSSFVNKTLSVITSLRRSGNKKLALQQLAL